MSRSSNISKYDRSTVFVLKTLETCSMTPNQIFCFPFFFQCERRFLQQSIYLLLLKLNFSKTNPKVNQKQVKWEIISSKISQLVTLLMNLWNFQKKSRVVVQYVYYDFYVPLLIAYGLSCFCRFGRMTEWGLCRIPTFQNKDVRVGSKRYVTGLNYYFPYILKEILL